MTSHRKTYRKKRRFRVVPLGRKLASFPNIERQVFSDKTITFFLSDTDKLTCIYKIDQKGTPREVDSVTYSTKLGNSWETVVYFDDVHGFLHRHRRITLENETNSLDFPLGKNSNNHRKNLRHAMNDIEKNFYFYRRHLLKANSSYIKKCNIDIYYH